MIEEGMGLVPVVQVGAEGETLRLPKGVSLFVAGKDHQVHLGDEGVLFGDARVGTTCGSAAIAFGLAAPVRYIHCACNVAYLPDLEEVRKLAEIVIKEAGELDV